ncbi:MAG: energy transducer TonB [Prevotella sp.]|jgi:protein TonB|nr:energy transducer TonB [Prevotella sp.]MCR4914708.1 energy transducer TonB [Prevotella sp.]
MAKIDLLDQKWIDLVFEGKNEAYGAYKIRQDTTKRNNLAMLCLLLGIAAIVGIFFAWGGIANAIAASDERNEGTEALEMVMDEQEEEEQEEEEIVYDIQPEEEQVQQDQLMNSEKFTDYAMDDEAPQEVTKTQDETEKSDVAISSVTFDQGSDEGQQVLKQNEVVVEKVEQKEEETKIFEVVEQMPQFPGGDAALMQYLSSHIKYPVVAEENGIQGRVVCTFVVERNGSITDVRVVKSVDPSLDKEAVRVIKSMPNWIPGKQNGSAVRVKYTVPVTFRLQ